MMAKGRSGFPRFKKSLGQNFLRDNTFAGKIAEAVPKGNPVVEIGPGDGFLTRHLLACGHSVTGVEIDEEWAERLKNRLKGKGDFRLILGNILKADWKTIANDSEKISVTGNLPFHIASAVISSFFDHVRENMLPTIETMVVMVQNEVGKRLAAVPCTKDYGSFTLLTAYHAEIEYLFKVPAAAFIPRPRVDGAVVRLTFRKPGQFPDVDYRYFRRIVRGSFAQRRKMMHNSLGILNDLPPGWRDLDFDFSRRPEEFSFDEFVSLTKQLLDLNQN